MSMLIAARCALVLETNNLRGGQAVAAAAEASLQRVLRAWLVVRLRKGGHFAREPALWSRRLVMMAALSGVASGAAAPLFLGSLPLDIKIRETSDAGTPIVAEQPDSPHSAAYRAVAEHCRQGGATPQTPA